MPGANVEVKTRENASGDSAGASVVPTANGSGAADDPKERVLPISRGESGAAAAWFARVSATATSGDLGAARRWAGLKRM